MGNPFKPPKQTTTSEQTPWGPQGEALQDIWGKAGALYDSQAGTPWYEGDLYAGMDPLTSKGINANAGYATGAGAQAAGAVGSSAQGMLPYGQKSGGAYDTLLKMGTTDPTKANIASAGMYADNPWMDGMIDAASRDVKRNLFENEIPGINVNATDTGNVNSSRAGVAEGIAVRGAQDQIGDISAQLRGQAYQSGLSLAEQGRQANMGAVGSAGAGYGDAYDLGLKGSAVGQDMTYRNNDALITGGQLNQQDAQGQLNADFQAWQGNDQRDWNLLQNYFGMVAQPQGGTTTQTQTGGGPSAGQQILGAATSALGAYKMFSDIRLKTDVQRVGTSKRTGLPIYTYKYRQDTGLKLPLGRHVGHMAHEVLAVRPEAVGHENGYLNVDYGKLR